MNAFRKAQALLSTYRLSDLVRRCWEKGVEEPHRYHKGTLLYKMDVSHYVSPALPEYTGNRQKRLTILYVVHRYWPSSGGTEHFTQQLAEKAVQAGHRVIVLCHCEDRASAFTSCTEGILWREKHRAGVRVIEYRHKRPPQGLFTDLLSEDSCMLAFGTAFLDRERPDIVHLTHLQMGSAMGTACRMKDIPYGITLTDFFCLCRYFTLVDRKGVFCERSDCFRRCPSRGQSGVERFKNAMKLLAEASFVAAPSRFVAERIQREYGVQVYVIPHDVELPKHFQRAVQGKTTRLLYAGKLAPLKGLQVLLPLLKMSDTPFEMTICGAGNALFTYKLKRMVRGDTRFRFAGACTREELWREYARADAVVIPSLCPETFCFTAHEAITAGCRVIATPMGALREAIDESGGKMLFRYDCEEIEEMLGTQMRTKSALSKYKRAETDIYETLYCVGIGEER